jgi:hypothetical protein
LLEGKTETVITAESVSELLRSLDTIPPVTEMHVAAPNWASLDMLCPEMAVRQ